jgi:nitrogen regulatory protein PII
MGAVDTPSVAPLPAGELARFVVIVRSVRVDAVMQQLHALQPRDVLIEQVRGYGRQKTHLDFYEEGPCEGGFLPKVRLQFVIDGARVPEVVDAIRTGARTGRIGDGKIFIHRAAAR